MNAPSRSLFAQAFDTCVGILRFRKGPEEMPASSTLLLAAIAGSGVLQLVTLQMIPAEERTGNAAVMIALQLGIYLGCVKLALRSAGHPERFTQTATAILGCQLVMSPALVAVRWLLLSYHDQPGMGTLAQLAYLVVAAWLLAVTVRILRAATEWPLFTCVMLVLGIEVLALLATLALFPAPPEAAVAPA